LQNTCLWKALLVPQIAWLSSSTSPVELGTVVKPPIECIAGRKGEFVNVVRFDESGNTEGIADDHLLPDGRIITPMKYSAFLHIPMVHTHQLPVDCDLCAQDFVDPFESIAATNLISFSLKCCNVIGGAGNFSNMFIAMSLVGKNSSLVSRTRILMIFRRG
jgi:hypothetical protein